MTELHHGMTVSFLRPTQRQFLENPPHSPLSDDDLRAYWREMKMGQRDLSTPQMLVLASDKDIVLQNGANRQIFPSKNGIVTIANLLPDTEYSCEVRGESITFTTADEPRVLLIEGVSNARDIGGMTGFGGRRVQYGRIIRSEELNSIQPDGLTALANMGICTDLDLRGGSEPHEAVLPFAEHIHFPVAPYDRIFQPEQAALWRDVFHLLTDESRYPMIVHCVGGIDRTGTLCLLLGLLLGVDKNTLAADYEFSGFAFTNFTERSRFSPSFTAIIDGLKRLDSDLHTAVVRYLLSIGMTEDEILAIRRILLG